MKKTILTLTVFLIQTIICFGQDSNLNSINAENNEPKSCRKQVENKSIGLSNITSDTLTYQQLTQCDRITIKSFLVEEITSYKLSYFYPGGTDLFEIPVLSNKLPNELIKNGNYSASK